MHQGPSLDPHKQGGAGAADHTAAIHMAQHARYHVAPVILGADDGDVGMLCQKSVQIHVNAVKTCDAAVQGRGDVGGDCCQRLHHGQDQLFHRRDADIHRITPLPAVPVENVACLVGKRCLCLGAARIDADIVFHPIPPIFLFCGGAPLDGAPPCIWFICALSWRKGLL